MVSLRLTGHHLNRMHARSGQFFLFRFLAAGTVVGISSVFTFRGADRRRAAYNRKTCRRLHQRDGRDPRGYPGHRRRSIRSVHRSESSRPRVLMIAGGIGITPIRAMLEDMSGDLVLIYRVVRDEDVIFREELQHLAGSRNVRVHIVAGNHTDPGAENLLSADHLKELVPDIASRDVYICGPPVMSDLVERNVLQTGVRRKFIHAERFAL